MARAASLIERDDTLLGVCFGLGEDFGLNPIWLRILFAGLLFWNPAAAIGAYMGLGALVALSRWVEPDPRPECAAADVDECEDEERDELPLAA